MSSSYKLTSREDNSIKKIKLVNGNDFIFPELYETVSLYKNKIDKSKILGNWDKMKKKVNKFELVNIIGTNILENDTMFDKNYNNYTPLSRAFFKLTEIYNTIGLIPEEYKHKSGYIANIAEGPGGFIEALYKHRINDNLKDIHYGLTLYSKNNKNIPGWQQIKKRKNHFLDKNENILLKSGSLYDIKTVRYFSNFFKTKKAFLVTADGGFDYSQDFNNQELNSLKIIYAEFVQALMIQEEGGTILFKMFDLFTQFSLQIIYLLSIFYEEVYIVKPVTSRPANSEKYIIGKKFKGIDNKLLSSMVVGLNNWKGKYYYIQNILLPEDFIEEIKKINLSFINKQKDHIDCIIDHMKRKNTNMKMRDNEIYSKNWLKEHRIIDKNELYNKKEELNND